MIVHESTQYSSKTLNRNVQQKRTTAFDQISTRYWRAVVVSNASNWRPTSESWWLPIYTTL